METKQTWEIDERGCLYLLPSIPDKSIDMILTDLPYGTTKNKWDVLINPVELWKEYRRIIVDNGAIILMTGFRGGIEHIIQNKDIYRYDLVWEKSNPTNIALSNKQPMRYHENLFVFYKYQPTYNKQMIKRTSRRIEQHQKTGYVFKASTNSKANNFQNVDIHSSKYSKNKKNPSSIIYIPSLRANSTEFIKHSTQKPIALAEWLIKTYTNEGNIVHDSCMGSGWSLKACRNLNRNYIGFEISNEWVLHYEKRLKLDNSKLTDGWNSGGSI